MNKKVIPAVVLGASAAALISACGPHHHPKAASSLASNPVVQQDAKAEQARISSCLQHGTILTKAGRAAFFTCAAGGMTKARFEACATRQLGPASLLTKAGRDQWLTKIGQNCAVVK